uniref:Uncharacterized protein n=1 Tax=Anguilla anguilla TaxID=7936 RepID=A0A0E9QYB7_ANGAN
MTGMGWMDSEDSQSAEIQMTVWLLQAGYLRPL